VFEGIEIAGIRVTERRFAAKIGTRAQQLYAAV
jgi:hypothetical protein